MTGKAQPQVDLAGTKEAAEVFGVRTENFLRDWARRPDFPAPIATLAATPVWRRDDLEQYQRRQRPVRWPPRRHDLALSPLAAEWLPEIKRRLVDGFSPDHIVLFGSQARGEARPSSDIDLLVVMPAVGSVRDVTAAMTERLKGIPVPVDLTVTTIERVARFGTLVGTVLRPALQEGITLYARR